MNERLFQSVDEFLDAAAAAGVKKVVLRQTHEHRPEPGLSRVPLGKYRRVDLLAYDGMVLYKCVLEGARPGELAEPLTRAGLHVTIVSGNIT